MNARIRKKHKWEYCRKKFPKFIHGTRKETFDAVVNHHMKFVTIPKCRALKCGYAYRRNVKRAAKWRIIDELRIPIYKRARFTPHLRFARHLQPKENNNE